MEERVIVALDLPSYKEAERIVEPLSGLIKILKVGPVLFISEGPKVIEKLRKRGFSVMLDLKFFDIPKTVERACRAISNLDIDFFTLHIAGGKEMIEAAIKGVRGKAEPIGVTILTSQKRKEEDIIQLAREGKEAGLNSFVCSPLEVKGIKEDLGKNISCLCPGIRTSEIMEDDQKRVLSPKEAIEEGADYIIIGRPIINSPSPGRVVEEIISEIKCETTRLHRLSQKK